jgi:uncharacterized membrane protein YbhN (UPF0104 family)
LRLGLIGCYFNTFLPGSVGGDILKAAFIAREQNRRTAAVATVLMDRAVGLWGLFWVVALLGSYFWLTGAPELVENDRLRALVTFCVTVVIASLAGWLLLGLLPQRRAERFAGRLEHLPKVGGSAAEFWRAVWMYRCRPKSVALALGISWVGFFGFIGCFYCCAHVLWDGDPGNPLPSLTQHFLLVPIGLVIMAMPLFPGGAGIGELGFGLLYGWFGYQKAGGILGSLVQRVLSWGVGLACFRAYLRAARLTPPAPKRQPAPEPDFAAVCANGDDRVGADRESFTAG